MTKGDLMRKVYTEDELCNVDTAIPIELWKKVDTTIHVVDYNEGFGILVNLETKAAERGITIN